MTAPWYLCEWAALKGKQQKHFVADLGWNKSRVSLLFNGKQDYSPEILRDVAAYLGIQPFELLMHPDRALAYQRMSGAAHAIANEGKVRTGG